MSDLSLILIILFTDFLLAVH